jgi:hypothetical protein
MLIGQGDAGRRHRDLDLLSFHVLYETCSSIMLGQLPRLTKLEVSKN